MDDATSPTAATVLPGKAQRAPRSPPTAPRWSPQPPGLAGVRDDLDLVTTEVPTTGVLHCRQEPAVDQLPDPVRRHAEDLGGPG